MLHVLELTPSDKSPQPRNPNADYCKFLPHADPGDRLRDCNWNKEFLQAEWKLGTRSDGGESIDENIELWGQIYKSITKRVTNDMDDDIHVYCTASNCTHSVLAAILESRNLFIQQAVLDRVTQETLNTMCEYCKVWVPLREKVELTEEQIARRDDGRTYRWLVRRWACI